jgi:cleavage and polyadenylation specificity factor subunit 4
MQLFSFEDSIHEMLRPLEIIEPAVTKEKAKYRTVMCTHWLIGMCALGSDCHHLHRVDKAKAPPCKHGKMCKIKNCLLKHIDEQEVLECIYFRQGFCFNGPDCKRKHIKRSQYKNFRCQPVSRSQKALQITR